MFGRENSGKRQYGVMNS